MKKRLPISLLVLYTALTGFSCITTYQNLSLLDRSYLLKKTERKELSFVNADLKKYHELLQQGNKSTIESVKDQSYIMIIGTACPVYQFKMNNIVSDEILATEPSDVNLITGRNAWNFIDDPVTGKYKKRDDIIEQQVAWAGKVSVRLYFEFTKFSGKKLAKSHTISVSQKTGG